MVKVAVVILNWNGSNMLQTFLPSVVQFSQEENTEIYVADNASTDDSVDLLKSDFPSVHIILLDQNYGFAGGYNRALLQVEAEYVVLLNSDVQVSEGWLRPLVAYMDKHQGTAACQPKLRSFRHQSSFEYAGASGGFIDRYGYPFCRGRLFQSVELDKGQYDGPVSIFWASGAAMFIRRADYLSVGGLDSSFFAHMEEIDLCWRLRSRGRNIVCIPQSAVYHVGAATLKKENPYKTMLNFRNNLIMLYKNLPGQELYRVMVVRSVLDVIAALVFILKFQFPNAMAVFKAQRQFRKMHHQYKKVREENMQLTTNWFIPERMNKCILKEYFLFRRHTYNALHWDEKQ